MIEVRWHGRGGQGAKTVAQLLADALLRAGRFVQAFPEYGPERSGAPMRAYDRVDRRPIRRHCAVTTPDVVVVLDHSLLHEVDVTAGLSADGWLVVNTDASPEEVAARVPTDASIVCVPGDRLAAEAGARFANVVLLGAVACVLDEPPAEALLDAARAHFGEKLDAATLDATLAAIESGFAIDVARPAAAVRALNEEIGG